MTDPTKPILWLADQVAIVTGASRGIGREIALALARQSATVVAVARSAEPLKSLAEQARRTELPGTVIDWPLDISDRSAIEPFVDQVAERFGRVDVLVNNAGVTRDALLMNMEDEQFDEVIATNLRSVFWLTREVSKYMVRNRYGRIVNISSVAGTMGNVGQSNYAASKAGMIGFSKSVAKELARRGITCNVIAPGFINTEMTEVLPEKTKDNYRQLIPCQSFGEPEDIAAAVVYIASPEGKYVNGQVLVVDGGLTM